VVVHFVYFVTLARGRSICRKRGLPGAREGRIARFERIVGLAAHARSTGGKGNRPGRREGDNEGDSPGRSPVARTMGTERARKLDHRRGLMLVVRNSGEPSTAARL